MKISNNKQANFTSRNIEIRKADQIMRKTMLNFPMISTTRPKYYDSMHNNSKIVNQKIANQEDKIDILRDKLDKPYETIEDFLETLVKNIKEAKCGNCIEEASAALVGFIANGYKDVRLLQLKLNSKESIINDKVRNVIRIDNTPIDHGVLVANLGKRAIIGQPESYNDHAIIIDPWRGFVDYVKNGLTKYDGIFLDGLRNQKTHFSESRHRFDFLDCYHFNINDDLCKKFAENHPELIVKD